MKTLETLEKIARAGDENFYDALNAAGLGDDSTVLASKARLPHLQDIVHSHSAAEIGQHADAFGALGALGGGAAGAGIGTLVQAIRKKPKLVGAGVGALALGLPAMVAGGVYGHEKGRTKAIKDLKKAKLI